MDTLLWPLGWVVSTQVLVNKNPPPFNKRPKRETWTKDLTDLPRIQWARKKENEKKKKKKKMEGEKMIIIIIINKRRK